MAMAGWLDERERATWRALMSMKRHLETALERQLASAGLSSADYAVLVRLTDQPRGRLRLFELSDRLGWERSRASHQVARMAARGLLAKELCASDRRGAFVAVTARGRAAARAAAPGHIDTVRRVFVERLTPEQLDAVRDAAESVLAGFAGRGDQAAHYDEAELGGSWLSEPASPADLSEPEVSWTELAR